MTLTDAGTRYLVRVRRILADVEEAEGAAESERPRPGGRLVVSAPLGFGRLHVSPVVTAYLKRYPEVSCELRLSDRIVNLVEEGVDLAIRIGHLPDSTLVARQSARCGGSWWPPRIISSVAASRRRRATSPRMTPSNSAP